MVPGKGILRSDCEPGIEFSEYSSETGIECGDITVLMNMVSKLQDAGEDTENCDLCVISPSQSTLHFPFT